MTSRDVPFAVPPQIETPGPVALTVDLSESFSLDCTVAAGIPLPSVSWTFTPASAPADRVRLTVADDCCYDVSAATPADSGTYRCAVDNGVGPKVEKIFTVTVQCKSTQLSFQLVLLFFCFLYIYFNLLVAQK